MKMKKGFLLLRDGFIGAIIGIAITIAICSAIAFGIRVVKDNKIAKEIATIELGMKMSDLKWLAREGKISKDELAEFQNSAKNLNIEEMNQLLDELLEGKEEEYLEEKQEWIEKIQSDLEN